MASDQQDRVEIGDRIKRFRVSQELTVHELANRSGISPGYLSEIERGLSAVSVDKLRQIANGLRVGVEVLLDEQLPSDKEGVVQMPVALSEAADQLNLSHRVTLTLLRGQRSLTARRSQSEQEEWGVQQWLNFYEQVKDYLPEC